MLRPRIIPLLLLQNRRVVKTIQFSNPRYIGDPINAARVFNGLGVDELCVLDIGATRTLREPDFDYIGRMADDCFMPLAYGGGVAFPEHAVKLFDLGIERVILNTHAKPSLIEEIAGRFGSQAVAVCVDVISNEDWDYRVYHHAGNAASDADPVYWAKRAVEYGAGEILLQSVNRDGTGRGYDITLITQVSDAVSVPVVAAGGARDPYDFKIGLGAGASACAAGSMFVYYGEHKAVLLNYDRGQDE